MLHHDGGAVAHLQRDLPGVLDHLHPVAAKAVAQGVALPFHPRALARPRQRFPEVFFEDRAAPVAVDRLPNQSFRQFLIAHTGERDQYNPRQKILVSV